MTIASTPSRHLIIVFFVFATCCRVAAMLLGLDGIGKEMEWSGSV